MELSYELLSQFASVTNDIQVEKAPTQVYGTMRIDEAGNKWVKMDGSNIYTPVQSTTEFVTDDRVIVEVQNHTATVVGNVSSPAVATSTLEGNVNQLVVVKDLVANKIDVKQLVADNAEILELVSDNIVVRSTIKASAVEAEKVYAKGIMAEDIEATTGYISELTTDHITTGNIKAATGYIADLEAIGITARNIEAASGYIDTLTSSEVFANDIVADHSTIKSLDTKYANIDFANIGQAAIEKVFADSGIIKDIVISEGHITGELVGVTIKGDLIEGNTVKADKLVVKGSDGLYYKLNMTGEKVEAEQTDENSLNGSVITAKSITATKIQVDDLVAFDATIGGFHITENSIYSGVKESATNTTRGVFLGRYGELAVGDANRFLRYYRIEDGTYKLEIQADDIKIGAGQQSLDEKIKDIEKEIQEIEIGDFDIGGRNYIRWSNTLQFKDYTLQLAIPDGTLVDNYDRALTDANNNFLLSN